MDWLNEPPDWAEADGTLTVVTGDRTDFWRKTHYGFIRDDGHFRHHRGAGRLQRRASASAATTRNSTTRPG